jgi:hypothetical protein
LTDTHTLPNLKSQVLWFGSPLDFKDPYDCALIPNIQTPTDDRVEEIRRAYLQHPEILPLQRQQLEKLSTAELREKYMRVCPEAFEMANRQLIKGVTCFSERNDNLLMWSHYADGYKGLCLEFATTFEAFSKVRKVKYEDSFPTMGPPLPSSADNFDQWRKASSPDYANLLCTKSKDWGYEEEWRAFHNEVNTEYHYPPECLTGVYFGPKIEPVWIEIVCLILLGQNKSVKFWRGKLSTTGFKVLFEPFTYTSYIEAKRKGLV